MKEFIKNLKRAWEFAKDQKVRFILHAFFVFIMAAISIVVPMLSAKIIVNLTESKFSQLLFVATILMFIEIFRNGCNYFSRRYSEIIYRESFTKIQTRLGNEILKIENKYKDR